MGKKGGGTSGNINSDINATIDQFSNSNSNTNLDLTGSLSDINLTTTMNGDLLDDVNVTTTNNATSTLLVPQPIHTISDARIDVKPLQADLCLTLGIGRVPSVCISKPYHHHFGVTLFGVEVLGMNFSGEDQTMIEDLSSRPQVILGPEHPVSHGHDADRGGIGIRLGP